VNGNRAAGHTVFAARDFQFALDQARADVAAAKEVVYERVRATYSPPLIPL
jgi:hypothetical protein